jgi:hypothetical protein
MSSNTDVILYGCAFEHFVLRGRIGGLWLRSLSPVISPASPELDHSVEQAFEAANAVFYQSVDWALDIRDVITREMWIDTVPGQLIRRDPERHVLVRREKALEGRWRALDFEDVHGLKIGLKRLAESGPDSRVFVIPDRHPKRESIVQAVAILREAGIAEPD